MHGGSVALDAISGVALGSTMRTAVLLSGLFVVACSVGEVPTDKAGPDGGGGANGCVERLTPPASAHLHTAGGGTNARIGCVEASCHLASSPGAGAPPFLFAGTVVKPGGTTASAGAIVRITAPSGTPIQAYTDTAGNFSILAGALPSPFPATATVTACPTAPTPMAAQLVQGNGDCNGGGACHGGAQGPITLADR